MAKDNVEKRVDDALLGQKAWADKKFQGPGGKYALDLRYGGMFGWSPMLGNVSKKGEFHSNQAYVSQHVIPILIEVPDALYSLPEPEITTGLLKALIELNLTSIEGLDRNLEATTEGRAIGGGGEEQDEVTDMKRAKSDITFTAVEKKDKAWGKFIEFLMKYTMMDPETKSALVGTLTEYTTDSYTPNYQGFTVLFIEPDVTHRYVVDAYITTNMMFKGTGGSLKSKMNKTAAKELVDLDLKTTGITISGASVMEVAEMFLTKMNESGGILTKDPSTNPLFFADRETILDDSTTLRGFNSRK